MSKVWSFGDSFAVGMCDGGIIKTYAEYFKEQNGFDSFEAVAQGGATNLHISALINSKLREIKKNDFVIVMSTSQDRFPYPILIHESDNGIKQVDISKIKRLGNFNDLIPWIQHSSIGQVSTNFEGMEQTIEEFAPFDFDTFIKFYSNILKNKNAIQGYSNYFNWFFNESVKNLKLRTDNVFTINPPLWLNRILDRFLTNNILGGANIRCNCHHWNEKGHKIVCKIIQWCIDKNIYYLDDNLLENLETNLQIDLINYLNKNNE